MLHPVMIISLKLSKLNQLYISGVKNAIPSRYQYRSGFRSNTILLLTSCDVHTGKYSDCSFEVRTE